MAEGDKFYWTPTTASGAIAGSPVLVAEHKGHQFENSSLSENGIELSYIQTFETYVRPELLYKLQPILIQPAGTNDLISWHTNIFPPYGAVLWIRMPPEFIDPTEQGLNSQVFPGVQLENINIQKIETLPIKGWLVTAQFIFRGFQSFEVSEVSFSGAAEEQILSTFNEVIYFKGDEESETNPMELVSALEVQRELQNTGLLPEGVQEKKVKDVPAINSAGSPIEMTNGRRQLVISMNFIRDATFEPLEINPEPPYQVLRWDYSKPIFNPQRINTEFLDTINDAEVYFINHSWPTNTCRLDKYDCAVVPTYNIDYYLLTGTTMPTGFVYRVSAQVTYDPNTFLRLMPDVGLMLKSEETGNAPRHIWAVETDEMEEVDITDPEDPDYPGKKEVATGKVITNWGIKGDMIALEQGDAKAEKITTPVFLDGKGWPAEIDEETGMQKTYYRHILVEKEKFWPMETLSGYDVDTPPVGFQGLLPTYLLTLSPALKV